MCQLFHVGDCVLTDAEVHRRDGACPVSFPMAVVLATARSDKTSCSPSGLQGLVENGAFLLNVFRTP